MEIRFWIDCFDRELVIKFPFGYEHLVGMGLYKKLTNAQLKTLTSMGLDTAYGVSSLL